MRKILILLHCIIYYNGISQTSKLDSIYNIANFYNKGYDLELRHDDYVFSKIETYYIKALSIDSLIPTINYRLSRLYYDQSFYYNNLAKKNTKDAKKNKKIANENYIKFLFYVERYQRITGKKVNIQYHP